MSETKVYGFSQLPAAEEVPAPELPYLPRLPDSYRPKIGLIGCGEVSAFHLKAYREFGIDIAALCSRSREKAEEKRKNFFPDAKIYTDYRELLNRPDIEVLDITPHPEDRLPILEAAIDAGKHVLSQKPFVTDLADSKRLVRAAEAKGVKLAVNQNGRWAPHFSYIRQVVAQGLLGSVGSATFSLQWDHSWTAGTPFDNVHHLVLFDFGIHWFDMVEAIFQGREARSVSATVAHASGQKPKPPMLAHVLIDFEDGQATLSFDGSVRWGQQDETVVAGDKGTIRSIGPSLEDQTVTLCTPRGWSRPALEGSWFTNGFQGTMAELLCAIEEDREPVNSARRNLRSLALCFAALESADGGGKSVTPAMPD